MWTPVKIKDISISHLLYADDVLLFAKVNKKSVKAIDLSLKSFMACSGMSINHLKSSIWFSPNTPNHLKSFACSSLGFKEANSPGSYLGIPLGMANRKQNFEGILGKIQTKCSSWSQKYLSPMGKVTLIRAVCSSILAFYMQCLPFPKGSCKDIDKCIRNFFWKALGGSQKIHLVKWDTLTSDTTVGGLGFFKSFERNQAFMGKLYWRMRNETNSTWAKFCHYRCLIQNNNSLLCKGLRRGKLVVERGSIHIIHSGQQTSFWFDKWLPIGPLKNHIFGPLPLHAENFKVAGNWNWQLLQFSFPREIIHMMVGTPRNSLGSHEDRISWEPNSNGVFSLKSAYHLVSGKISNPLAAFNWIWKLTCHPRKKFFIWLIRHNAIPSNFLLAHRGLNVNPLCVLCGQDLETAEHLFKDCQMTNFVWTLCHFPSNFFNDSNDFFLLAQNLGML